MLLSLVPALNSLSLPVEATAVGGSLGGLGGVGGLGRVGGAGSIGRLLDGGGGSLLNVGLSGDFNVLVSRVLVDVGLWKKISTWLLFFGPSCF